jgi:hypothetical protein
MTVHDRLHLPRRLSSQLWLLTLPSALISFERRQAIPRLPVGAFRFAGVPLIALGVALGVWAWRNPQASIGYQGPAARLSRQPATVAGLLVVGGAGLLLRSAVLTVYALGLAVAATTETIEIDEPRPADLLGTSLD